MEYKGTRGHSTKLVKIRSSSL